MVVEMSKMQTQLNGKDGIHFSIVPKNKNGFLHIRLTKKLLFMQVKDKVFTHDIIKENLHCIKDVMLLRTLARYCHPNIAIISWEH